MTSWKRELEAARKCHLDTTDIVACTLSPAEMAREFDGGYGLPEGAPFLAWSESRVYFCVQYDGSESVGGVPRNPSESFVPGHIGG